VSPLPVAVIGAYTTPVRRSVTDQNLEEMVFEASKGALADAGLSIRDIDALMLSTSDQVEGRIIESMVTNGAAGGVGMDVTTLTSAGEHAFVYAYLRLQAQQSRRVLVVVWSKESESVEPVHADWLNSEPFLLRPLGMRSTVAAGLQASAYVARHGFDENAVDDVRRARWAASGRTNEQLEGDVPGSVTSAWPLTAADLPVGCDVACAMVIATADAVTDDHTPAWIDNVGWVTERYDLAERDVTRLQALEGATRMAFGDGGSARDADVVEVQEISTVGGFAALEALGLAAAGSGAGVATGSSPVINPSGGNLPANPGNAAGFMRLLQAAQQVRGRAGGAQVEPRPGRAVGAALHGFAGQGAAVVSFTTDKKEVA
jgi:acetyl-CoA C-acetyltransferase